MERKELIQAIERVLETMRGDLKTGRPHHDWDNVNGIEALAWLKRELIAIKEKEE